MPAPNVNGSWTKQRKDADALRAKRQEALQIEQRNLSTEIVRWTRKEVFAIMRKTLADLSGASLEERMSDVFVGRCVRLPAPAKDQMVTAFKTSNHTVSVHSAFDLPSAQQNRLNPLSRKPSPRTLMSSSRPRRSW